MDPSFLRTTLCLCWLAITACKPSGADTEPAPAPSASGQKSGDVAARVGDQVVTVEEVQKYIARLPAKRRSSYRDVRQIQGLVKTLARNKLLAAAARERGLLDDAQVQRVLEQALITELLKREIDAKIKPGDVPPIEVDTYLKEHPDELSRPDQVRVGLILISDRQKAAQVALLARKAPDIEAFRKLVAEHSEDQPSKLRGGVLPLLDAATTKQPKPLVEAAFKLENAGDVAGPIATDKGYAIVRLLDKRAGYERPLKEVRPRIEKRLRAKLRAERVEALVKELSAKHPIEIQDQNLKRVRLPELP